VFICQDRAVGHAFDDLIAEQLLTLASADAISVAATRIKKRIIAVNA
jgi:hypothetical protein